MRKKGLFHSTLDTRYSIFYSVLVTCHYLIIQNQEAVIEETGFCPGGRLSEPEAAARLDFRIIPGSAPEGGVYPV